MLSKRFLSSFISIFGLLLSIQLFFCQSIVTITAAESSSATGIIDEIDESTAGRYVIEGKVYPPELYSYEQNWQKDTAVTINDGEYNGFLKEDGSFVISNVPSGSYVVEIINPDYYYESVRLLWL